MLENAFKQKLCKELKSLFRGAMIIHVSPFDQQGIPDLLILYKDRWAALEVKKRGSLKTFQPNQEYFINIMNQMSFAKMICPENKEEVMYELQRSFQI